MKIQFGSLLAGALIGATLTLLAVLVFRPNPNRYQMFPHSNGWIHMWDRQTGKIRYYANYNDGSGGYIMEWRDVVGTPPMGDNAP